MNLTSLCLFFFIAGIISLLDEEEPQLKVRINCTVAVGQMCEDVKVCFPKNVKFPQMFRHRLMMSLIRKRLFVTWASMICLRQTIKVKLINN